MKFLYSVLIFFSFIGCKDNFDNQKKLINSFVRDVILNNSYTSDEVLKFINLDSTSAENKKELVLLIIDENVKFLREKIQSEDSNYLILSDKEAKKKEIDPNFQFDDYSKVYHLIIKRKVITSFVIKDNKIISFSYNIIKNKKSPRTPLLLFK